MSSLPAFSLRDIGGHEHSFPTGRPALLCFVREDCPTCGLTMPLIDAAHRAFGAAVNVWSIGQEGNEILVDRHKLSVPMLDDTAVKTSFAYNLEIVPTIILADSTGGELARFEGFAKRDWQDMVARLAQLSATLERSAGRAPRLRLGSARSPALPRRFSQTDFVSKDAAAFADAS